MKNLTVENIAKVCDGTLYGAEFVRNNHQEAAGVVLDSRLLQEGYVFLATKGEKVDGDKREKLWYNTRVKQSRALRSHLHTGCDVG